MKKFLISVNPYLTQSCERCGSKKRVSRTWEETVQTFSGETTVAYSQIICTNKDCQIAFDKNLVEETNKRKAFKLKKEQELANRKAHNPSHAPKTQK